ncbi:MFS transporter [Paenibacillus sp. FSL M7-1455]|uniref:MFS transporter n=1 Tax=Paenibacillus sp. FSL M7-1455 TaxID=2975316 RepID=UPI000541D416|nr:Major Facilitator Superfamily protein [Paenibacillus sp. P1XP2]HWO54897.1 MFS transporter [Paenibacillus cookii]
MKTTAHLNRQSLLLLAVNGLIVLAGALSGTFLNVYLWKSKQDYAMIGWFTVAQQVAVGLTFWLGGKWVKEYNKMNALRAGIVLSGLFYLFVLWAGPHAVRWIWPLGLLLGIAMGLFWLSFNVVYFEVTDRANRDLFNGWVGLLGSVTGIVGPWFSGLLITWLKGDRGYRVVFTISLAIYGLCVVLSFFLKKRKNGSGYHWMEPIAQLRSKGNPWRLMAPGLIAQGVREGVFAFLIGLLVFVATKQESKLGQFTLITSAISLLTYWLAGKWFKPKFRSAGMLVGALLLWIVIVPLLWKTGYGTLLVFGIGTSVFMPLYILPMISSGFDLMGTSDETVEKRVELVVLRELSLMAGRLLGTFIFIAVLMVSKTPLTITVLMLVLGASPIASWIFVRKLLKAEKSAVTNK